MSLDPEILITGMYFPGCYYKGISRAHTSVLVSKEAFRGLSFIISVRGVTVF